MKHKLLLFLFFNCFTIHSQDLIGKWEAVTYQDEISSYDKRTNSIFFVNNEKPQNEETFKKMVEQLFFTNTYEFDTENNLVISGPMIGKINGKYEIDKKNKKIKYIQPNKAPDYFDYEFENNVLKLKFPLEEEKITLGFIKK